MKNKGSLFTTLFIMISFLMSLIIIIFVSSLYISTTSNLRESFTINRKHNLEQMTTTLESELQNIEYAFNAYSTTSSYQSIIENPLGPTDFEEYREISTQLNYFSTPNLHNTTYSLVSLRENWAIIDGRLVALSTEEKDELREHYIDNEKSSLYWNRDAQGMNVVTNLPTHSRNKNGIGIAHVATSDINHLVNSQDIHFPLLILDTEGQVLYDSDYEDDTLSSVIPEIDLDTLIEDTEVSDGTVRMEFEDEEDFTLMLNESSFNNLVYVTALFDYEIKETAFPSQLGFIVLGSLLILFSIGLAYISAIYLTKPLRQLKDAMYLDSGSHTKNKNDFDFIKQSFETMKSRGDTLQHVLNIEKPALKRQFILNAFLGKNTLEQLEEKQLVYNFPAIENPVYYVLVTQLDNRIAKDDSVRLFKLVHLIEETIPSDSQFSPVVLSDESVGTLLVFDEQDTDSKKRVVEYGETIVKHAKDETDLLVSIGISPAFNNFNETRSAYKKANRTLSYKMLLGNQSIISYEDIQEIASDSYSGEYSPDLEETIFKAIQLGNVEEAKKQTYPFLAALFKHNPNPLAIEFGLLRFFINITKLDQSLETNILTRPLIEKYYQTILFHRNLVAIEDTLVNELIIPMAEQIQSRTTEQFKQVSVKIKEIIHEDFEEDISLDTISEELNYNPNYLSSIFKKETGTTFSSYLIDFRFDKAKEWLIHTDMTVKEIAERLKYGNSQNFIRSFKKRENLTPGKYRKEHAIT